jgi:hypothetical protein
MCIYMYIYVYIYMEMSQGNQYIAILNKNVIFFFYIKGEQEGRTGPVWGVGTSGRREDVGRGCRRVNMVEILCTHVCKWKNEIC